MADNTRHSTFLPTVAVLMVVGLAVYITWFIAPHFEDHFAMYKMIVYETNTGLTKNFHYINDIMGWETLLGKLQLAYPAISWWSVAVGGTVLLCSVWMAFMLGRAAAQNRLPFSLWLMLMTLILIFTEWNVFWLHHNRAAFAMASVGVLGSLLQSGSHGFNYTLKRTGWVAVFAAGICWRFEAGVAAFVLLAPLFFEYGQFSASPNFLATIGRATGCKELDFKCWLQFLQNHRKQFIVIGTEQGLAFIEEYAQKMYKLPLTLRTTQRQHLIGNTYLWLP